MKSISTIVLAILVVTSVTQAWAQTKDTPTSVPEGVMLPVPGLKGSIERLRYEPPPPFALAIPPTEERRQTTTARKFFAGLLGATGGLFAGGLIGGAFGRDCGCDDPGLLGIVIGAPIGAVLGGYFGGWLAQ